jgi:type IV pilus assembly protein PilW
MGYRLPTMTISTARRPQGFSLIELMVATTIGLILTMLIGQIFINSRQVFSSTDNLSRMQENARYALITLTRAVRLSSYKSDPRLPRNDVFESGVSGVGPLSAIGAFRTLNTLQGTDGGTTGTPASGLPDSFTVFFQGSGDGIGNADGTVQDCAGRKIDAILTPFPDTRDPTAAPDPAIVVNTYLIQPDPNNNNEPTLFCNTQAPPAACTPGTATCLALIAGVENMQLVYGEDQVGPLLSSQSLSPDGSVDRFVPAGSVANWNNVLSIRISLLMRTDDRVAIAPIPATTAYAMSGTNVYAPGNDTRLRRVFTTVIDFRNRSQ